jgi:hypothetical protein
MRWPGTESIDIMEAMVKHIVMWNVVESHEGMNREQLLREIKSRIEGMRGVVPQVREIEVGIDFNGSAAAWDIVLYSTFDSRADLDAYQVHPAHEKIKTFVGAVTTARAVVDYET